LEATHPCTSPIRQRAIASVRDFQLPTQTADNCAYCRTHILMDSSYDRRTDGHTYNKPVATGDPAAQDCNPLASLIHHERSG